MSAANILIYLALIVLIVARRFRGHPVGTPRRLFALPVIVTILGYEDLSRGTMKPLEVTLTAIGAALALGLGLARGRADKVTDRDGSPYVQWGVTSLILFLITLAAKLVLDLAGVAAGGTSAAAGKSLVFTLGLTLAGEAVVVFLRSGSARLSRPPQPAGHSGRQAAGPLPDTDTPAPGSGRDPSAATPGAENTPAPETTTGQGQRPAGQGADELLLRALTERARAGRRQRNHEDHHRDHKDHHRDHKDHHRDHEDHLLGKLAQMMAEEPGRRDD